MKWQVTQRSYFMSHELGGRLDDRAEQKNNINNYRNLILSIAINQKVPLIAM